MTDITEIVKLDVSRTDGVKTPANGFPFLLIKAVDNGGENAAKDNGKLTDDSKTSAQTEGGETGMPVDEIVKEAVAEATRASEERIKALEADLAKVKATAIPGGPAMTAPAHMRDKAEKAEKLNEAAYFAKLAEQVPDLDLKKYYKERAEECRKAAA